MRRLKLSSSTRGQQAIHLAIGLLAGVAILTLPTAASAAWQDNKSQDDANSAEAQQPTLDPSSDAELIARHPLNTVLVADPAAPDATLTLAEIVDGVRDYQQRLTQIPTFLMHSKVTNVEQGVDSEYGHPIAGFEQIIAHQGNAWLAMRTDYEDEDFVPYSAVWRDGITLSQEYRHFSVVWGPGARFSRAQLYTYLMGIDILLAMPDSQQLSKEKLRHSMLQRDFFDKQAQYTVLPKQYQVDGAWCHVVHYPGFQTLWIDPELGFAVRKRYYNWNVDGACERMVHQQDFQEVATGVHFPFKIVDELYAQPLQVERPFWNLVTATSTTEIVHFATENLSHELFDLPIQEGTEVYDFVRKKQFIVVHEGEEPFFEALEFSRSLARRSWTTIGLALGALGGLLLAGVFARKIFVIVKQTDRTRDH